MATIPTEDQELIDSLKRTMRELYDQEEAAARANDETRRKAVHHQISLIRGLIRTVVDYHINNQTP
jgi:hypothetical protein